MKYEVPEVLIPEDIAKKALIAGSLSSGHARTLLALEKQNTQIEAFKKIMDAYYLNYETIKGAFDQGRRLYVTHTLPRRKGEMDLRIDNSPGELMFKAIAYSVSIRSALIVAILGV